MITLFGAPLDIDGKTICGVAMLCCVLISLVVTTILWKRPFGGIVDAYGIYKANADQQKFFIRAFGKYSSDLEDIFHGLLPYSILVFVVFFFIYIAVMDILNISVILAAIIHVIAYVYPFRFIYRCAHAVPDLDPESFNKKRNSPGYCVNMAILAWLLCIISHIILMIDIIMEFW